MVVLTQNWKPCADVAPTVVARKSETESLAQGWTLAILLGISGFVTAVFYHQMMW